MPPRDVRPGWYDYESRRRVDAPTDGREPTLCISRRVADFPNGLAPNGATISDCDACGVKVATDGRFPHRLRLCLQCAGITPLPIDPATPSPITEE